MGKKKKKEEETKEKKCEQIDKYLFILTATEEATMTKPLMSLLIRIAAVLFCGAFLTLNILSWKDPAIAIRTADGENQRLYRAMKMRRSDGNNAGKNFPPLIWFHHFRKSAGSYFLHHSEQTFGNKAVFKSGNRNVVRKVLGRLPAHDIANTIKRYRIRYVDEQWAAFNTTKMRQVKTLIGDVLFATAIREPVQRLVSSYYFTRQRHSTMSSTFSECEAYEWVGDGYKKVFALDEANRLPDAWFHPEGSKRFSTNYYVKMLGASTVDGALEALRSFGLVLCTERISTTCASVVDERFGWESRERSALNKGKGKDCALRAIRKMDARDPEGMSRLRAANALDIELFSKLQDPATNIFHPCCFAPLGPEHPSPQKDPPSFIWFHHFRKCGGSFFHYHARKNYHNNKYVVKSDRINKVGGIVGKAKASEISQLIKRKHLRYIDEQWIAFNASKMATVKKTLTGKVLFVTAMRDPLKRLVSSWYYTRQSFLKKYAYSQCEAFENGRLVFALNITKKVPTEWFPPTSRRTLKKNYYVSMLGVKTVESAIETLKTSFDLVLCTERISTTCADVVKRTLGWTFNGLRVRNKGKGPNCTAAAIAIMDERDSEGMSRLRKAHAMDIELFSRISRPEAGVFHPCCFLPPPAEGPPVKKNVAISKS